MTFSSPITVSIGVSAQSTYKGSTYGKLLQSGSSDHSFQELSRSYRLNSQDGIKVLYNETTLCSLQSRSIILVDEQSKRDTTIARDSETRAEV